MQWHLRKENEVVLSYRWQFQDGRSKGMGTEWDKEVVSSCGARGPLFAAVHGLLIMAASLAAEHGL